MSRRFIGVFATNHPDMHATTWRAFNTLPLLLLAAGAMAQVAPVSYHLETLAGSDFVGDGGPATLALLVQAEGVAVDSRGSVYVADAGDHRVRKISSNGIVSTVAGNGRPGFSGDGGPATAAQLRTPYGLAVDRDGNLYIADLGNARIRRVSADGIISTVAGGGILAPNEGRAPTEVALIRPRNVAIDFYGTLYFTDFGAHRAYQLRESGMLGVVAGTGAAGFSGDGGPAVRAQLDSPAGIVVDPSGNVLIADSANGRIRKVWRGAIATLADSGVPGAAPAIPVRTPAGLALDPDGSLFIADIGGNQILRVTPALAVTPVAQPARDLVIDAQGNLYTCSGPLIYRRPRSGSPILIAGSYAGNYTGDNAAGRARLQDPSAVARDLAGNLYVADTGNHRIRKITPDGSVLTVAGNGARGFGGDSGLALGAQLDTPGGVAVDRLGNLYIGDTGNHRVRRVDAAGVIVTLAGTGARLRSPDGTIAARSPLDAPTSLAVDREGNLYVSETGAHSIRKISTAGILGTVVGNGSRGYFGDGGPAIGASLDSPQGIALDADGNLFIADAGNHRIRRVSAPSGYGPPLISTFPDPNAAIWRGLRGIAAGNDGRVYVADAEDARLFRVDGPGQILVLAGTGVASFSGESGPALRQALNGPSGLAIDGAGSIYFADAGNNRIRKLTPVAEALVSPPPPASAGITVVSAASLQPGPIAAGQIVSIFGQGLGPAADTQALFNGRLAALFFVSQTQINLQVPDSIAGMQATEVRIVNGGVARGTATLAVNDAAPALFTLSEGIGQAAALNEDGSYNSESNPAERGSVIVLFATGEGRSTPALPVTVKIAGYAAEVLYAGPAPGFPGLMQINARVPGGFVPPGPQPVSVQVGAAISPSGVTVALR